MTGRQFMMVEEEVGELVDVKIFREDLIEDHNNKNECRATNLHESYISQSCQEEIRYI